jgi:hypothetical protein
MKQIHQIEAEHIGRLQPAQLVGLLRKLLYAEVNVQKVVVHVPEQITVPDGGEDGRWEGAVTVSEYIPNSFTIYQAKAQDIGITECGHAVLTKKKDTVIRAVDEVLSRDGCYVFFCGHPYVQESIDERIEAANKELTAAGRVLSAGRPIRFLDGNKIAAWTNQHAAAVAHVCECCGLPPVGELRTWSDWSRDLIFRTSFHSNQALDTHIYSLRQHLSKIGRVARITGHSGLGKTRLAYEALRLPTDEADVQQKSLSHSVAYVDMEQSAERVLALVSSIEASQMRGLIVVDNCERSYHQKLVDIVQRQDSKLRLLTLDYVPESPLLGTLPVRLEPDIMEDIVPRILQELPQAKRLTEQQLKHIASYAHGFPQIASLMVEVGDTLDWTKLDQRGLARKLLWGRGAGTESGEKVLRALSIFGHVGFEGERKAQKTFVRELLCGPPPLNERDFDQFLRPFRERRILQKAGGYRLIAPLPLAVALAAEWWEVATEEELKQLLPLIEAVGLTESFCSRAKQLHFSENASNLVAKLCGASGPLSDAGVLNSEPGSRLFRAFVELNPAAASDCLWRVFGASSIDDLRKVHAGRRSLVWALEKICWNKELFIQGAQLLLLFAAAEVESFSNNASGQFKHLFQLYLAGTQMPAVERLAVIEAGLASGETRIRSVCVEALGVGLVTHHFSRTGGVEVRGSGLPEEDWSPKWNSDVAEYWTKCFSLLAVVVLERSSESALAQNELGRHLRGILKPALLEKFEPEFRKVADALNGYWPEALSSLRSIFEFDVASYPTESLDRLKQWIIWITPSDLPNRLSLVVIQAPYEHEDGPDGKMVDLSAMKAEQLADELVAQSADLRVYLDRLQQGDQRQTYVFGRRFGQRGREPSTLIEHCLVSLEGIPTEKRNVAFLAGVVAGLPDRTCVRPILERVATAPQLIDILVPLTRLVQPGVDDIRRIVDLIAAGKIPAGQLRQFSFGSVLDELAPRPLLDLLQSLVAALPAARAAVFDVLSMYTYNSEERWLACRKFIRELLISPQFLERLEDTMDLHHWEQSSRKLLKETRDEVVARELTLQIIGAEKSHSLTARGDTDRRSLLATLLADYPCLCWPLVGAELLSPNHYRMDMILGGRGFDDEQVSVVWNVPCDLLVAWVRQNPVAKSRLLAAISLFYTEESGVCRWHPIALALFNDGVDDSSKQAVGRNLYGYGSTGSRVPYIEKRLKLLRELEQHSQPTVREMARVLVKDFEADKAREQVSDEEEAAGIY